MITNIKLENFKCFRQLDINPKLLTVLIGPNGTGKSSVLQALLLLKQSVGEDQLEYQGELINLGSTADIAPNYLEEHPPLGLGFEGNESGRDLQCYVYYSMAEPSPPDTLPLPHDPAGTLLKGLRVVPAVRGLVRPRYSLGVEYVKEISLQDRLGNQESQLATNLAYSRPSEERLSKMLRKVTGTGLRAEMSPPQSVEVKSTAPSGAVNMVAEGFGANALIQLLYQLITAEKGATVLIEEPEIHLHPKAQAELAETLAETAKAEDKQIIMTTHSEHIAGRLLTLVAENRLTTDELAIYSFEKDEKGECAASEIEITERGQTKGGLRSFFDTDLDEVDRYIRALAPKQ